MNSFRNPFGNSQVMRPQQKHLLTLRCFNHFQPCFGSNGFSESSDFSFILKKAKSHTVNIQKRNFYSFRLTAHSLRCRFEIIFSLLAKHCGKRKKENSYCVSHSPIRPVFIMCHFLGISCIIYIFCLVASAANTELFVFFFLLQFRSFVPFFSHSVGSYADSVEIERRSTISRR